MPDPVIRLHHFEPASRVNGPGTRAVIWVQGCALGCPGCFNPVTHDFQTGKMISTTTLFEQINAQKKGIDGITISGGEPVYQHRALARLFEKIRRQTNLSILVFSGYTMEEIKRFPRIEMFLEHIDVMIAGRYDQNRRIASGLIGSSNKTIHFLTERYSQHDLDDIPQAEVVLSSDGTISLSGIDPLRWKT